MKKDFLFIFCLHPLSRRTPEAFGAGTSPVLLDPIDQEDFAKLDYQVMRHPFESQNEPPPSVPRRSWGVVWRSLTLAVALAGFAVSIAELLLPGKAGWPDAALLLTMLMATLGWLACQLPGQNVILATTIIAVIGSLAHGLSAATGIPFGAVRFTKNSSPLLFNALGWPIPLIWVVVVLNSRGVARMILRPWRKFRDYGLRVIGLTTILSVLLDAAMEPYASQVRHYWIWEPMRVNWLGVLLSNSLGWLLTALLILAFATAVLIDKRLRSIHQPTDYCPLALWLSALTLFIAGDLTRGLWVNAACASILGLITAAFAIRGARW